MDFKQYKGKNILAWLWFDPEYYNPDKANTVCYIYPRVLVNKDTVDLIDPADFPKHGAVRVNIYGGETAEDVYNRFGSFVSLKINEEDQNPNYDGNNMYSFRYNSSFGKTNSGIWIEKFSGKGFYQIIDVNSNMEVLRKERSIPVPDFEIRTTLILLRWENKLYGPFECGEIKEEKIPLNGMKGFQYSVGEYDTIAYNDDLLVIENRDGEEALILIPKASIPSPEECEIRYDWISEETLIDNFIDSLRAENSYTREQVRQLKEMVHQLVESSTDMQFTGDRIAKIQALLQSIGQKEEYIRDIVEYALADESMKTALSKEVLNNYFDRIQSRILEFSSVQEHINVLKAQEATLQKSVEALKESTVPVKTESSEEDKLRISKLTQEAEELRAELGIRKEIEALKTERARLKEERDKAKDSYNQQLIDNNDLKKQFDSTLQAFNNKATQTARILDSKLLDKILRGIGEEPAAEDIIPFNASLLHAEPMDCADIIKRVTDFIRNNAHRDVTSNDVANYLICITQGFITTFAGEPGTGKTSLCNIIAKALGLVTDIPQRRFIDISVERGWSSHKDFIGYYNPLSKKMERSNSEVFDAFERMDSEYDCDRSRIAPFIILLDEANLSPIEHYWAAFLRNCDFASVSNRSIPLGGTKSFKLPEQLRFLATVNFDHTTEELSPRFLDRSWVIMLEPTRVDDEIDEDIKNNDDMVSFGAMKAAFCIREDDVIDEAMQNKWNAIQKIFRDRSLQIMPRNLKMVKNYCAVGCRCMECDTPATKFAPLDYALSQKILPTINGNGENYRMLIEDLLKECTGQNMPISVKHLERMKRVAENNMGFYQFFSR
jgi:hypothetical protein